MKKEKPKDQGIIKRTMPIGMKIVVIGGTGLVVHSLWYTAARLLSAPPYA